jgi:hypothetical protein
LAVDLVLQWARKLELVLGYMLVEEMVLWWVVVLVKESALELAVVRAFEMVEELAVE